MTCHHRRLLVSYLTETDRLVDDNTNRSQKESREHELVALLVVVMVMIMVI